MVRFKGGDDRPKVPRGSGDFEFCNVQPCYEAFIKYLRGGAVMDKREIKVTILGFTSILVIAGFVLGFITQAGAETLKSRSVATATKAEQIPVNDEPGHILVMQIAEGLALFENGETAKMRVTAVADTAPGKGGQAIVYAIYTFGDGSTVVTRSQRLMVADKSGTVSAKATGEIIKGTGRFEGIKGTVSGSSTNYLPSEGEAMKVLSDHTWTYTVPRM
jgi:hypothetical protein